MGNNNMGLIGAISYIVGNIVGSGIFISPSSIITNVESVGLTLIIWVLAALISILGAFCYVELGTSIRRSGADFAYICYVKWYPLAFSFMFVGCILTYPATLAVQAQTFSEYIIKGLEIEFKNSTEEYFSKKLLSFALIWLLLYLNFFSIKTFVSRFQAAASLAKVFATGIIIVTGFYWLFVKGRTEHFEDMFANSTTKPQKIVDGLFAGLFSYDGWDIINFGMEEVDNPKRTMPLAIVIAMSLIALFYLAMNISYFVILAPSTIMGSDAVAVDFAQESLGNFRYIVPLFISILLIGTLNSTMFSASRYLYAASREGHLPAFISCINKVHDSPRVALFVHTLLAIIFSFAGDLDELIQYISFAQWSQRMFTMIALMYIRFRHLPVHPDAIRTPIVLPVFFFIVCSALTVITVVETPKTALIAIALLLGGFCCFMLFKWEKSLNRFEWYQYWSEKLNTKVAIAFQLAFNGLIDQGIEEEDEMGAVLREHKERKQKLRALSVSTTTSSGNVPGAPCAYTNDALCASSESSIETLHARSKTRL
uniref:AA_permease domain-containing protein n=1 Tax=Panagrellus redivivus TaxID=6233 RepID=A0A7E5A1J0_PANRE